MSSISPKQNHSPQAPSLQSAKTAEGAQALRSGGGVVDSVRKGVEQLGRELQMGWDAFEAGPLRELGRLFGSPLRPDRAHDGKYVGAGGKTFEPGTPLSDIPAVTPRDNPSASETILYVNGIMTPKEGQGREMQAIADRSGARVIGIHNATQGMTMDLAQCVADKLDKGRNPAVDTLADTVYSELKAGRDVHLMGYSQGGLITARALYDVEHRLRVEDGLSKAQAEELMSHLKVETFGAASFRYPDGPKYVHYVNNADPVPTLTGLGGSVDPLEMAKHAGRDAVIHRFTDGGIDPIANHMLDTLYLHHRVPFDEARAGRF